jgi:hypothetical protein
MFICHPSGWIELESFTTWFEHFISVVKPSKVDPVLLNLEGLATDVRNLNVIDLARKHSVSIICPPPHTTHYMQPLDVSFMKPLTVYYKSQVQTWIRRNPESIVTHYERGGLFGAAYSRAASIETVVNGFKKTCIYPINCNIFADHEFVASDSLLLVRSQMNEHVDENRLPASNAENFGSTDRPICNVTDDTPNEEPAFSSWDIYSSSSSCSMQGTTNTPHKPRDKASEKSPLVINTKRCEKKQRDRCRVRGSAVLVSGSPQVQP